MKTLLVTAFEPFGPDSVNPTEEALKALPGALGGAVVEKLLLPVEFERAPGLAEEAFDRISPDAVVLLGQAGGRSAVTPEAEAANLMDARMPDNAGYRPEGVPVVSGGAALLSSTLPNEAVVRAVETLGLRSEISHDAGRYVCNALLYRMLHHVCGKAPVGFIHVPFIRSQVEADPSRSGTPFMELDDILRAVEAAIAAVALSLN